MGASRREKAVEYLKAHPGEDVTTNELSSALEISREQAAQTLHGLIRHGLGGQLRRTGQSTWLYEPPMTVTVKSSSELASEVPVGFRGHVQVTAKLGDWYIAALIDPTDDYKDRGMRLWLKPVDGSIVFEAPNEPQYEYAPVVT